MLAKGHLIWLPQAGSLKQSSVSATPDSANPSASDAVPPIVGTCDGPEVTSVMKGLKNSLSVARNCNEHDSDIIHYIH